MAEQKSYPTIPVSHWLSLRTQFKKSIPGSITTNYLASILNMSEASAAANILPGLRNIGLIDSENKTNQDMAKKFRDDSAYSRLCEEIIKKTYPEELIDAFPDKDSNRDQIKKWFMNHTGSGENAASKLSSFYITLLEADASAAVKTNGVVRKDSNKPKQEKSQLKSAGQTVKSTQPHQEHTINTNSGQVPKNNTPDLNINIQIHISSDASSDQIKSIFENMAKYLYKN